MAAVLVFSVSAMAQKTSDEYATRYSMLVNRLGITGVGVETLIQKWESEFPDDVRMLAAKFTYYYTKSQSSEVVEKPSAKYKGNDPVLSLDDSLGVKHYYFEEVSFSDSLFSIAGQAVDRAISVNPNELNYRISKITALLAYEQDSPDMAAMSLKSLIDYNYTEHPAWTYNSEPADPSLFDDAVQEYCYSFFKLGSPQGYNAFKEVSEKMLKYQPSSTVYLGNMGSYYFVAAKDNKTALKYYQKVLKLKPDDYTAIKNCVLMARKEKNTKLEMKYLPLLAKYSPTESERIAAKARLDSMK